MAVTRAAGFPQAGFFVLASRDGVEGFTVRYPDGLAVDTTPADKQNVYGC